jgi:hypothetical protein
VRVEQSAGAGDFHGRTIKSDVESLTLTRPSEDLQLSCLGDEMPDVFSENLLRMIGAVLYQMLTHQTAQEMFGKSYMALGAGEKLSLEQTVFQMVASSYQAITPENLRSQQQHKPQAGFQAETAEK